MIGLTFSSDNYNEFKITGDKDLFERVVVDLTLKNNSDDIELVEYINSLPKRDKRIAVASLIGNDNILWGKINNILNQDMSSYKRLQSIYFLLKDYVKIADVERKQHGEILTPFKELAEPMIKLVEKYDVEFWKNKYNKVLDSSAGYGTFLILSAYKFMVGLKEEIEDEEERFKWIVENCLYYGELQSKSVFSWLLAIDPYDEYKTNTYWGSFLTDTFDKHAKEVWGVEKFDLIIQNPPYQEQKVGFTKTQPIWNLFFKKSIEILKENGYMVMIHPNGWRNIDGIYKDIQNFIKNSNLLEIRNISESQSLSFFDASIYVDYYILKNNSEYQKTLVINSEGDESYLNIKSLDFIPDGNSLDISKFISKDGDCVNIIHSFSSYETRKDFISKEKSDIYVYPCVSNVTKSEGLKVVYSSVNNRGHFGIPKIICGLASSGTNFFIDEKGEYGMTQFSFAILDDIENLYKIKKALKSEKFKSFQKSIPNNSNAINFKILKTFKKDFWKEFI